MDRTADGAGAAVLDTVTVTGIDHLTDLGEVRALAGGHSFLEWGVLLSASAQGQPRYPPLAWVERLRNALPGVRLAGHVCGRWAKEIASGRRLQGVPLLDFDRVQLNVSTAMEEMVAIDAVVDCLPMGPEYIVQVNSAWRERCGRLAREMYLAGHRVGVLFDSSGGRGIAPSEWPAPLAGVRPGYAGGLGPDTLERQLPAIATAAGAQSFWVDMEGRVRTSDDVGLDFVKVAEVLRIAGEFRAAAPLAVEGRG